MPHDHDPAPIDDCWNRIGVRGDRSCPRLEEYLHCRLCPVYADAAKRLLTRVPASGDAAAQAPPPAAARENAASLLIFRLRAEWLALPTDALAEVTPTRTIHSLPRRSGLVLGVCNVRGHLMPCVSLAVLLDLAPAREAREDATVPRMLVLAPQAGAVVIPVDEIAGIQDFPPSAIGPLPDTLAGSRYAEGMVRYRERAVGLIDSVRLARAIEGRLA